eukprot:1182181-Prorocentrum_minimum.AAC.5
MSGLHFCRNSFASASTGWVVGTKGKVIFTNDGGATWTQHAEQLDVQLITLRSVQRPRVRRAQAWRSSASTVTAWVVGDGATILHTTDGGASWTASTPAIDWIIRDLHDVYFADPSNGWIAASAGAVLRSADGGVTWERLASMHLMHTQTAVHFVKSEMSGGNSAWSGWAAGADGGVARTRDGGVTWENQTSCTPFSARGIVMLEQEGYILSPHVTGPPCRWLVGDFGTVCYTLSGGRVWTREHETSVRWGSRRRAYCESSEKGTGELSLRVTRWRNVKVLTVDSTAAVSSPAVGCGRRRRGY